MLNKFFLPPDVFLRHAVAIGHFPKGQKMAVLDVGGSLGVIKNFLPDASITTADISGADVTYDGKHLPFDDRSFDAVVSIDTLEHVPPEQRVAFIKELVRVAKDRVAVVAPFASVAHENYERRLKERMQIRGQEVPDYLFEHRKYGLVTKGFLDEIKKMYPGTKTSVFGNVFLDRLNFAVHLFEVKHGKLNRIIYVMKFLWNIGWNLFSFVTKQATGFSIASRVVIFIVKR